MGHQQKSHRQPWSTCFCRPSSRPLLLKVLLDDGRDWQGQGQQIGNHSQLPKQLWFLGPQTRKNRWDEFTYHLYPSATISMEYNSPPNLVWLEFGSWSGLSFSSLLFRTLLNPNKTSVNLSYSSIFPRKSLLAMVKTFYCHINRNYAPDLSQFPLLDRWPYPAISVLEPGFLSRKAPLLALQRGLVDQFRGQRL